MFRNALPLSTLNLTAHPNALTLKEHDDVAFIDEAGILRLARVFHHLVVAVPLEQLHPVTNRPTGYRFYLPQSLIAAAPVAEPPAP